jgi:CRISPR-associated protein Cas1
MPSLFLTTQGSHVRKEGERLVVEKDDEILGEIPCLKIDTVVVYGMVHFTAPAFFELMDQGIELSYLTLSGKLRGQLTPGKARNTPLRMTQFRRVDDTAFCLGFAREVVRAKIANGLALIKRFRANHPERPEKPVEELERALVRLETVVSLDELRGVEGSAASCAFEALGWMIAPEWGFHGRNRRPPRDPMNALLSFGYVLAGNELKSLLDAMGFDPYVGFYHQIEYGRPSLALDLLEELRPALVDRFSANLLNLGALAKDDFTSTPQRGCFLKPEGLKKYFAAYQRELSEPIALPGETGGALSFREIFRRQAERLAKHLLQGEPYVGFRYPC